MNKYVLVMLAVLCAAAAFGAVADTAPSAGTGVTAPEMGTDSWGQMIRSWTQPYSGAYNTCAVWTYDNYLITAQWNSFNRFLVYNTSGSLVRSVSASGASGARDGCGKNHLGSGYFFVATGGPGPGVYFTYTAGGNPGTSPSGTLFSSIGRGIGWDGTYYYCTTASWSSPLGVYNTSGSMIRTVPLPSTVTAGLYGNAGGKPGKGTIVTWDQAGGYPVRESNATTGSQVRSFTMAAQAGGIDQAWSAGYLYLSGQNGNGYIYDGEMGFTNVAPSSLGKIKGLYR
jgi:hypothetical protein